MVDKDKLINKLVQVLHQNPIDVTIAAYDVVMPAADEDTLEWQDAVGAIQEYRRQP